MSTRDDAVAALDAAIEAARVEGAQSRDAEVAQLTTQNADDRRIIDALSTNGALQATRIIELERQVAVLQAWKDSHPDPEPEDPALILGMNFTHTTTGQVQEALADAARIYLPAGITDVNTLTEFRRAYGLGIRVFVLSWKDRSTSTIGPMLDSVPDDCTVYGVAHHEPEDDMDPADWRALQAAHMPVVRAHGASPWAVLMAWTLDPASGRRISDWVLPAGMVDGYGFDLYPKDVKGQAASIARIKAVLPVFGVTRWLLGEYGVPTNDPANGVQLISALKPLIADADVACYWSSRVSSSKPDYHFSQQTADAWLNA